MTAKSDASLGERGRREKSSDGGQAATYQRVVHAAVESIVDLGFFRGSNTNEIARRAGVTWGVIQYHFGTREGLMLAVLEDGAQHMFETVAQAHIDAPTVEKRMAQLIDIFADQYASAEYLASLQVLLNMDRDPRTSTEIRETMVQAAERSHSHFQRLLREALGPATSKPDLVTTIFLTLRGFGLSQQLLDSMAYDHVQPKNERVARQRRLLAEILTPYINLATRS
jgi:AcrR family transcriptional regulator